jgi:hypothetical protein
LPQSGREEWKDALQSVISESAGVQQTMTQLQNKFIAANRTFLTNHPDFKPAADLILQGLNGNKSKITTVDAYVEFYEEVIAGL